MSEPDPFASPYHRVDLPGGANAAPPPGYRLPGPMAPVDPREFGPRRPVTTTVASWCWLAATALVVLGLPGLVYTGVDALADQLVRDSAAENDPVTGSEAAAAARLTPVVFALGFAVLSVPFVVAALKLRSGRNWARVLLTVFAVPAGLFGVMALLVFATDAVPYVHWAWGVAWSWVFLGACALGFVAMYLPASNAYARAVAR